jgi:hypothetical protein
MMLRRLLAFLEFVYLCARMSPDKRYELIQHIRKR